MNCILQKHITLAEGLTFILNYRKIYFLTEPIISIITFLSLLAHMCQENIFRPRQVSLPCLEEQRGGCLGFERRISKVRSHISQCHYTKQRENESQSL